MKVLLDDCMPQRLPDGALAGHEVTHVHELGWQGIQNGELLKRANNRFDVLLTIDKNMPYQQSLKGLEICVAVLDIDDPSVKVFSQYVRMFAARIESLSPGSFNLIVPES